MTRAQLLAALLLLGGCNAILGLERVTPRPVVVADGGGGGGGQGGAGGAGGAEQSCEGSLPMMVPAATVGDSLSATDTIDPCPGEAGSEVMYALTAPDSGWIFADVIGPSDFRLALLGSCDPSAAETTCCSARKDSGCDDSAVETCVCDIDTTCCDEAWDQRCVEQAAIYCAAACDPLSCVDERTDYEQLIAPVAQGQTYYLLVEGAAPDAAGTFVVGTHMLSPCVDTCNGHDSCQFLPSGAFCLPDGGSCADALPIADGTPSPGDTTSGFAFYSGSCAAAHGFVPGSATGPENVYLYAAPADGTLTIELTTAAELYLYVRGACAAYDTELGCANDGIMSTIALPVLANEIYAIFVDTFGAPGAYTLTLTLT